MEFANQAVGKLDHIAMVVDDLAHAIETYRTLFFAETTTPQHNAHYGFSWAFVDLGYSRLRLMQPDGPGAAVVSFFGWDAGGGIHHVCYRVEDIVAARDRLESTGARRMGDGGFKTDAAGNKLLFLRQAGAGTPLIKLEQA